MNYDCVLIDWEDHMGYEAWGEPEEILKKLEKKAMCRTIGWLIKEDKEHFYVASSLSDPQIGSVMKIIKKDVDYISHIDLKS